MVRGVGMGWVSRRVTAVCFARQAEPEPGKHRFCSSCRRRPASSRARIAACGRDAMTNWAPAFAGATKNGSGSLTGNGVLLTWRPPDQPNSSSLNTRAASGVRVCNPANAVVKRYPDCGGRACPGLDPGMPERTSAKPMARRACPGPDPGASRGKRRVCQRLCGSLRCAKVTGSWLAPG